MANNPWNVLGSYQFTSSVDQVNDSLPFWQSSTQEGFYISLNTLLNITGAPVGTTDSQTLTNKTLTSPTISGPTLSGTIGGTYTIGGTPTFPASVVQLTSTQTLTNKTLTSPTINSPTISNATITADTVSGFTTSNNGTIYGMSVTGGLLASAAIAGQVNTAALATNAVGGANLATNAITLGYAQITSTVTLSSAQTTPTLVTGLTLTVTIPSGGRKTKITAFAPSMTVAGGAATLSIWSTAVNTGTQLQGAILPTSGALNMAIAVDTPVAGSKTYAVGQVNSGSNNTAVVGTSTAPAFILVELI